MVFGGGNCGWLRRRKEKKEKKGGIAMAFICFSSLVGVGWGVAEINFTFQLYS